jgi:hypothetical protein
MVSDGKPALCWDSLMVRGGMLALLILAILILEFLRRPGAFLWPTLFAEDGYVFYRDQLVSPSWKNLFEPFAVGARYYLPIPRLTACLSELVPTEVVPWVFNGVGLLVGAFSCALLALRRFRQLIPEDSLRVLLCLLFAVTLDNREVLATAANCFWLAAIPVFLLAAAPPEPRTNDLRLLVLTVIGGVLLGSATPGVILAAPIALWQVARRGRERRWAFPFGLLIAAVIQISLQVTYSRTGGVVSFSKMLWELATAVAHRVVLSSVVGINTAVKLAGRGSTAAPVAALVLLTALTGTLLLARRTRLKCLIGLYVIATSVLLVLEGRGVWSWFPAFTGPAIVFGGQRYFYWASCAFAFLVVLGAGFLKRGWREGTVVAVFAAGIVGNFPGAPSSYLKWNSHVVAINLWRRQSQQIRAGGTGKVAGVIVPINPAHSFIYLPGNVTTNGNFETGMLFPWFQFGNGKVSLSSQSVASGGHSIVIEGDDSGVFEELDFLIRNRLYHVTARARAACGSSIQAALWVTDLGLQQVLDGPRPIGCGSWEDLRVELRNSSTNRMRIHLATGHGNGQLYWSNVRVDAE